MKRKVCLSLGILICSILLLIGGNVQAAVLQANPQTQYTYERPLYVIIGEIRTMEAPNGTMGLTEQINTTTLLSNTTNNIDVHCTLSTEYGAMAILSASGYGNKSNARVITSTTGNNTGIMLNTNHYEWVASIGNGSYIGNPNRRYYNEYGELKIGDALGYYGDGVNGCEGWHSASTAGGLNYASWGFVRGHDGIFGYDGDYGNNDRSQYYARATVVCGQGL